MKLQHFSIPSQTNYRNAGEFVKKYVLFARPPKSEFVEGAEKMKSLLLRHFIYVKLRTAVDRCKNLPFAYRNA